VPLGPVTDLPRLEEPARLGFSFMTEATQISAQMVNDLRSVTGAGLMDCKRALVEAAGNIEAAIDILRKKGLASAAKKADRTANEGLVASAISADAKSGAIIRVSCETDFVAKTDDFKTLVKSLAEFALKNKPADVAAMEAQILPSGHSVKDTIASTVGKLGENMALKNVSNLSGDYVETYIHMGGKVGVLLALSTTSTSAEVKTLAKDVCMHIAASSPIVVTRDQVPAELVAKEKEIATEQAKGKPAMAVEKIVTGKVDKFYAQSCLLEQPFVKNPDASVAATIAAVAKTTGATISVKSFVRLQVGA
jgi:elongation factor Ts